MPRLTGRLLLALIVGCSLTGFSAPVAAAQVTPTSAATPRAPTPTRGTIQPAQTAAIATIVAADATATVQAGVRLTAVAATATQLAQPTATLPPSPTAVPTLTALPSPTPAATATPVVVTPTVPPELLANTRDVFITVPVAIGDERLEVGARVQMPRDVALENGAIPPNTPIRTASGAVLSLPSGPPVTAVEGEANLNAPLNATLARAGSVGDASYPAGTAVVLPSGSIVLGRPEPQATMLLRAGDVVQIDGRLQTLQEPLAVVVGAAPVAQPATLPRTGDAEPLLWPAGLGLLLVLLGWRLRRST
jgi:hypothetical protein